MAPRRPLFAMFLSRVHVLAAIMIVVLVWLFVIVAGSLLLLALVQHAHVQ